MCWTAANHSLRQSVLAVQEMMTRSYSQLTFTSSKTFKKRQPKHWETFVSDDVIGSGATPASKMGCRAVTGPLRLAAVTDSASLWLCAGAAALLPGPV